MGTVEERNEDGTSGQINKVVHIAGKPSVIPRERGNRSINEIPPSEIAEVMRKIVKLIPFGAVKDKHEVFRQVLTFYQLKSMTQNTIKVLDLVWQIHKQQE